MTLTPIAVTQGVGRNLQSDLITGVDYPVYKLSYGLESSAQLAADTFPYPTKDNSKWGDWLIETSTNLGVSATFTGTARDTAGVGQGITFGLNENGVRQMSFLSAANVVGTLNIEVSHDATTWHRILSQAAAQVGGGTSFVAQLTLIPVVRYARSVYVNGAGAQTTFMLAYRNQKLG